MPQGDVQMNSDDTGGRHYILIFQWKYSQHFFLCLFVFLFPSVLEKKLNEAETEKFNIKQMKDMFEQKAAQLATEIVGQYGSRELRL